MSDASSRWVIPTHAAELLNGIYGDLHMYPGFYAFDLYQDDGVWRKTWPHLNWSTRRHLFRDLTEAQAHLIAALSPTVDGEAQVLGQAHKILREAWYAAARQGARWAQ